MADVKYQITADSSGAVTSIKKLDDAFDNLQKEASQTDASMKKMGRGTSGAMNQMGRSSAGLWKQFAAGQFAMLALTRAFREMSQAITGTIKLAIEQENQEMQLEARLKSTRMAAGLTKEELLEMAKGFQEITAYGDEAVIELQSLMLTFTSIGRDVFPQAIQTSLDMSTALGQDLKSSAIQLGKALQDPILGVTALRRVGVNFNEEQTEIIKNLVKSGDVLKAQQLILKELSTEFGGAASAAVETFGGKLSRLGNYWGDVREAVGKAITENDTVNETIENLTERIKKLVESDDFKLWVSAASEMVTELAKGVAWAAEGIAKITDAISGAKGYREFLETEAAAHDLIIEGVNIFKLRRQAIDQDAVSVKQWGELLKKYGHDNREIMRAIAEGTEGKKLQEIWQGLKEGHEAAVAAAEKAKPALERAGQAFDFAAKRAEDLKEQMKVVFTDDARSQLEQYEEALRLFGSRMIPSQVEEFKKRIAELSAELAGGKTDAEKVDEIFKKLGVQEVPELTEKTRVLELALARLNERYKAGKIDLLEYERQQKKLNDELEKNRTLVETKLPAANKELAATVWAENQKVSFAQVKLSKSAAEQWAAFGDRAASTMEKVQEVWSTVNASMSAVFQQAQTNRMIGIENEYKTRLATINKTIKDEEERQAAITALEAEFQIKRTEAQAAGAKQAKAVALMEAIVNTAAGVARAFKDYMFPVSAAIAGIVGALGAVQIAMIAKQPIPLARGAVFKKPTVMTTSEGATYEVAEEGVEYLVPEKHLKALIEPEIRPGPFETPEPPPEPKLPDISRPFEPPEEAPAMTRVEPEEAPPAPARPPALERKVVVNINSPLISTTGLSSADLEAAGDRIYQIVERRLRVRGRI